MLQNLSYICFTTKIVIILFENKIYELKIIISSLCSCMIYVYLVADAKNKIYTDKTLKKWDDYLRPWRVQHNLFHICGNSQDLQIDLSFVFINSWDYDWWYIPRFPVLGFVSIISLSKTKVNRISNIQTWIFKAYLPAAHQPTMRPRRCRRRRLSDENSTQLNKETMTNVRRILTGMKNLREKI